jgi:hypothetical protein
MSRMERTLESWEREFCIPLETIPPGCVRVGVLPNPPAEWDSVRATHIQSEEDTMAIEFVPRTSIEDLMAEPPHTRGASINRLWRSGASAIGPLSLLVDAGPESRLDLLEALRVVAMSETHDAGVIAHVLENARSSRSSDGAALHSAATFAITSPEVMRWISANPVHVAASPNWIAALPGLGGAVVSVPLAEEALGHLVATKADLPRELTRFVQLNPWFTLRFAVQFRRYTGGKRIRLAERAATARAWSHARSLLRSRIPAHWHSHHGRGAGRALDQWSHRFLVKYAGVVKKAYRADGIPPAMAALFSIASAADVANPPTLDAVAGWRVLPAAIERDALDVIGLGPSPGPGLEPRITEETGTLAWRGSPGMNPTISWL